MTRVSTMSLADPQGEALTLCLCWDLIRRDGIVLRVTDHDRPIEIEDRVYAPSAALEAGRFVQAEGLKPGRAAGAGVLSSDLITPEDLIAGKWDGCRVDVSQVDWCAPGSGQRHV